MSLLSKIIKKGFFKPFFNQSAMVCTFDSVLQHGRFNNEIPKAKRKNTFKND